LNFEVKILDMFPFYKQLDAMDCGPTCIRMIAKYYGKSFSLENIRNRTYLSREGVSFLGMSDAAESIGFRTQGVKISLEQLMKKVSLPCVLHWNQNHFVVLYKIKNDKFIIADPARGVVKVDIADFKKHWLGNQNEKGLCLLLEPTPNFYQIADEKTDKTSFSFLFNYIKPYKKFVTQLIFGLLAGSIIQLIFPFLTQSIVDFGINNQNLGFITLILVAQLILFLSRLSVDFIRGWLLLHISSRVNISLISDFFIKLMGLPVSYFDTKHTGDIMQRISDHKRIESFLTGSTLSILFSLMNMLIFGIVLAIYNIKIFLVFLIGSILYILWVNIFLRKRRTIDYQRFEKQAENQNSLIQLIEGMQEIKLNNYEKKKRWEWERIQAGLFRINVKSLSLSQYQRAGASFINESKNILITFLAATLVIKGGITLGMMLAIQYIIGQLNSPLEQMIVFFNKLQDARISLERLGEIHNKEGERAGADKKIFILPEKKEISIEDVSFQYEGPHSPLVLEEISFKIPEKNVTAIVGSSGSGKTTLMKLILGFYKPVKGEIKIGDFGLESLQADFWRSRCGVVMQDGFIFSETILDNIVVGEEKFDQGRFLEAVRIANVSDFIKKLPLGFNTKIGANGHGLSQGQKQRILIARAVYKNPDFLFFDEATNALDANNERLIMQNLDNYFKGKTVLVIAHRLSTVKNAGQIIVLDEGKPVEKGTHEELTENKGVYYNLVKNQLELGN
jgi:ATP-binding cassette subfamily B protein